ncbi:PIGR protein, partial [Mionectes macconnelli]|nr:PIGR protein [Mionectes macconnelli]
PVSGSLYGPRFLTGGLGGSVTHQCFYSITPANKHDRKYWCKVAGNGVCYTIISSTDPASREYEGRLSLQDDPRNGTFAVTMAGLRSSDTGRYRCGIGPTTGGLHVSLNLTVLADAGVSRPIQVVQGKLRGSVTVLCPSGDTQSGGKRFWCKVGRASCTLLADSSGYVGRRYHGRIFITPRDSSGAFKVLINDLTKEDSGLYMCGVERLNGGDSPREVALQVTTGRAGGCTGSSQCQMRSTKHSFCPLQPAATALPRRSKFLSGTVGGSLSFQCHYDPKGSYERRYLCRWEEGSCSLLLDTDGFVHESYKGRIQTTGSDPDRGTFTVVMSQLREEDSGWYWCRAESGHTEHSSSVKLLIQKETCSSQDPETTTPVKSTSSSPAASSISTPRSISGPVYMVGTVTKSTTAGTVTETTSALLPSATPPGTSGASPGETYHESSSGESRLLPVVLPPLALLIGITITVLTLVKMKLRNKMGEIRNTPGCLEAEMAQAGLSPLKEETVEETSSPGKVQECKMDSGKCRWVFSGTG